MDKPEKTGHLANILNVKRPYSQPGLYLGTSVFTANGWQGSFYSPGMQAREFLTHYATKFRTVEVDSTFYGTPSASTVEAWNEKTPSDFVFSVKVPQVITHEKVLVDCDPEFDEFIDRMNLLSERLGPLVLQFPFFSKSEFKGANEFLPRLRFFLKRIHKMPIKFVVETRNKTWLYARFADVLREYNVALALTDTSFLPRPWEMNKQFDVVTASANDKVACCPAFLARHRARRLLASFRTGSVDVLPPAGLTPCREPVDASDAVESTKTMGSSLV
jgi:uncharacterized protein YecE (DUF72 family)